MDNSFTILNKTFKEFFLKINLHILLESNVVICCCMLHNLILNGKMRIYNHCCLS
jgi:hypothetical protein